MRTSTCVLTQREGKLAEKHNRDDQVVQGFGEEWARFAQDVLPESEMREMFGNYFAIFPWAELPDDATGADIGCGSGRWAVHVAPRVGQLVCVDASPAALQVARRNLAGHENVRFELADVGRLPFAEGELDFAYSLGVLHHVPDTAGAIADVARILKPGGIFLIYLYYAFDNRPAWFRMLWRLSDGLRIMVCRLPSRLRFAVCELIAATVYWPVARIAALISRLGMNPGSFPLWFYRDKSFYVMRTDALDRFGTRLEKRFTQREIRSMLQAAGLTDIQFSPNNPFWCATAKKLQCAD